MIYLKRKSIFDTQIVCHKTKLIDDYLQQIFCGIWGYTEKKRKNEKVSYIGMYNERI